MDTPALQPAHSDNRRPQWNIFAAALAVRLLYVAVAHTWRIRPGLDHAAFGWEMGRVARALATGRGFADPFLGHTGPTAWVSPLYPLLLACVFKLFGVYTNAAAVAAITLNCVFSALTALATFAIGQRCFDRRVALWAAWIWALYPPSMQFAARSIWETSLSTLLLSCAVVLALQLRGVGGFSARATQQDTLRWLSLGVLAGLLALSNPSTLLFLAAAGVWILRSNIRQLPQAAAAVAVCVLMVTPWMLRNHRVLHQWVPVRSNGGAELYLGNGPGATGLVMEYDHPFFDPQALASYRQLGEVDYAHQQGSAAAALIRQQPARFAGLVARRVYFFWCGTPRESQRRWDKALADWLRVVLFTFTSTAALGGLALTLRRRKPAAGLLAAAFLLLPVVYYAAFVQARFRHPLEPMMAVLGVWLFQNATQTAKQAKIKIESGRSAAW